MPPPKTIDIDEGTPFEAQLSLQMLPAKPPSDEERIELYSENGGEAVWLELGVDDAKSLLSWLKKAIYELEVK